MFREYTKESENYSFGLLSEFDADLLPEILPIAGIEYEPGRDKIAFQTAQGAIPHTLFQNGGWYFQSNLLKAIAGIYFVV